MRGPCVTASATFREPGQPKKAGFARPGIGEEAACERHAVRRMRPGFCRPSLLRGQTRPPMIRVDQLPLGRLLTLSNQGAFSCANGP